MKCGVGPTQNLQPHPLAPLSSQRIPPWGAGATVPRVTCNATSRLPCALPGCGTRPGALAPLRARGPPLAGRCRQAPRHSAWTSRPRTPAARVWPRSPPRVPSSAQRAPYLAASAWGSYRDAATGEPRSARDPARCPPPKPIGRPRPDDPGGSTGAHVPHTRGAGPGCAPLAQHREGLAPALRPSPGARGSSQAPMGFPLIPFPPDPRAGTVVVRATSRPQLKAHGEHRAADWRAR